MSELLKTFDAYNDFDREPYFTLNFDGIASEICLEVPLKVSKEKMEEVLIFFNLAENEYEIVYKIWKTEDSNNADFAKDYPNKILFKSRNKKSVIWIDLSNDTLYVEFLYDCKDLALENWILKLNHSLRKKFGLSRSPTFKVLTKNRSGFQTEAVRTESINVDIENNYNDNFQKVHQKILDSIESKKSGLILLYGEPGTGKTTYIKSLISKNSEQNFVFIQNEFINSLLEPDFISFLLKQRNAILILEDAEKVITSRDQLAENSVVSTILQLTDGLFSDYLNIKIICTFNTKLSKIDTALLRKGRLMVMYEFEKLEIEKTRNLLSNLGYQSKNESLTISEIYNFTDKKYEIAEKKKIGF